MASPTKKVRATRTRNNPVDSQETGQSIGSEAGISHARKNAAPENIPLVKSEALATGSDEPLDGKVGFKKPDQP